MPLDFAAAAVHLRRTYLNFDARAGLSHYRQYYEMMQAATFR